MIDKGYIRYNSGRIHQWTIPSLTLHVELLRPNGAHGIQLKVEVVTTDTTSENGII